MKGYAMFLLPGPERATLTIPFPVANGDVTTLKECAIASREALDDFINRSQLSFRFEAVAAPEPVVTVVPEKDKQEVVEEMK
jgi:hypothetical protein